MTADSLSPLLQPWPGQFGGVPPWDDIDPTDFPEAFERAIHEAEEQIEAIAADPSPPTFDNTVAALERRGDALDRLGAIFGVHAANLNVDPVPDIQRTVGPLLAAHGDRVVQNGQLFARVEALAVARANRDSSNSGTNDSKSNSGTNGGGNNGLDGPSGRLLDDLHRHFVRNGARLDTDRKAELAHLNQRLASLHVDFSQHVMNDEAEQVTWVEDPTTLAGLPESVIEAAAATAAAKGREGAWAVANTRSAMDPVLTMADDRDLRERVWRTYYARGEGENWPLITEILELRARRAELLGYPSHAHWRLETEMARTPEAAMDLLMRVWNKAVVRARSEVADMESLAGHPIQPWDHRYWSEKVRRTTYAIDSADIEPYLQLEKLIDAMLWCAQQLHGLRFELLQPGRVPVFHPDVRVWEVTNSDGDHLALWYLDPYARPGKLSGAWMNAYRNQQRVVPGEEVTTLVSNNSNFVKPADTDKPVLISWDDATTLFHEFGHALHGILSDVTYPSQSGTSVPRDYVEFPSQLNEHWLSTTEVLQRFCRHHETDEPMPAELIERIDRASAFNQGFDTCEYLAAAIYDLRLHLASGRGPEADRNGDGDEIDPAAFERDLMTELGVPTQIVMRHRPTQFAHIFSGDGYAAAYYSYLWADALTADAAEAFTEAGGFYDPDVAGRLRRHVLSVGDTIDPSEGFRSFRGRDVDPDALLRKRGLAR